MAILIRDLIIILMLVAFTNAQFTGCLSEKEILSCFGDMEATSEEFLTVAAIDSHRILFDSVWNLKTEWITCSRLREASILEIQKSNVDCSEVTAKLDRFWD